MNYRQKIGKFGEELARDYLIAQGYKILAMNVRSSYQEIDIVSFFQDMIVFVEVKTRTSSIYGRADDSITSRKIKYLKIAMSRYLAGVDFPYRDIRLDLVSIDLDIIKKSANIKHYKSIF